MRRGFHSSPLATADKAARSKTDTTFYFCGVLDFAAANEQDATSQKNSAETT
jgi:hypothetical protein